MLISTNHHHHQNRMKRLFAQLSTLYEESQDDNEDKMSEYDIIESIEGIFFVVFVSKKNPIQHIVSILINRMS
mgnify:CR=1 FL=1